MDERSDPDVATVGPEQVSVRLRLGLLVLVWGLLALCVVRAAVNPSVAWQGVTVPAVIVGGLYTVGPRWVRTGRSRRNLAGWLVLLLLAWLGLLALTPDAVYLAFVWFVLLLHLLPRTAGLLAVGLTTVVAVAGFIWHQPTFTAAMVIGPVLGAVVAVATVRGYQGLQAVSEQRRRLIVELESTRAELAAAERHAGMLSERERLAREIHDTLAQGLTSIQLLLRAAGRSLEPDGNQDTPRAASLVEQARQAAQDNLGEARRFVRDLSPAALEHSSLPAALERLCDTASARGPAQVHFHHEGTPVALPTPIEVALLRIAQSAVANTTQHSGATRADITLTVMDDAVSMDIVDNGCGFDPAKAGPHAEPDLDGRGFGLISMRSRAAELGGTLTVESDANHGTAVSVHLDLPAAAVMAGTQP